jgi:thymidine phosphorylase
MRLPQEIIRRKRDGLSLADEEIAGFVAGFTDGSIGEGQAAAFAMAIFFRGLSRRETAALTRAMQRSGMTLDWSDLPGPALDKHSSGGVGDKVSLMLAPLVAACGGFVPMISGRALGHTGGTLDKLDSIPGYRSTPDIAELRAVVRAAGCAIIGQTAELAPADRRLYAIRDVTATVETIPLLTASILSKKLAAGLAGLVMDVKWGSGAFMTDAEGGLALAESIVGVAHEAGLPTVALLTDMNEVLGHTAGNALEVGEAIRYLTGGTRDARLHAVTIALASELLLLGGLAGDLVEAEARITGALSSGAAAERFARMVALLGGPADLLERAGKHLAIAPHVLPIHPPRAGFVAGIDVRRLGIVVAELGGGRRDVADAIDPAVGLSEVVGIGAAVGPEDASGRPLALLHARSADDAERIAGVLSSAFTIAEEAPPKRPVIGHRMGLVSPPIEGAHAPPHPSLGQHP